MKLSDLMPKLYELNIEMNNIIISEQDEFDIYLQFDIDSGFLNTFAKTADKDGLTRYEEMLDLKPDSNYNDLNYRRNRVLAKLSTRAPLSMRWLIQNLTGLVGENNFKVYLDNDNYKLYIQIAGVYNDIALTLNELYRPLIPANMEMDIKLFDEIDANIYVGIVAHEGEFITIKAEEEVQL